MSEKKQGLDGMDIEAGQVVGICAEDLESEISLWLRGHVCLRTSSVKPSVPSFPLACGVRHFLPGILSLCFSIGRTGQPMGNGGSLWEHRLWLSERPYVVL